MRTIYLQIALVLVVLIASTREVQAYRSIFGKTETSWVFRWGNLSGIYRDSSYVQKDTVVNSVSYKKVVHTGMYITLLREDTTLGIVWGKDPYNSSNPGDTNERIIFRYDLNVGDTFHINNSQFNGNYPISYDIVDSIKIIKGLKYIYFGATMAANEPFAMVEGIGSNMGVLCKNNPSLMVMQYLLCSYKDGEKTSFENVYYHGNCNPPLAVENTVASTKKISLYPNPTNGVVKIVNQTGKEICAVQVWSTDGRLQKVISHIGSQIFVGDLPQGLYHVRCITDDTQVSIVPLVIQ